MQRWKITSVENILGKNAEPWTDLAFDLRENVVYAWYVIVEIRLVL